MPSRQTPLSVLEATLYGTGTPPSGEPRQLISPTTHMPFASMSRRRLTNLTIFLVIALLAAVTGVTPWQVPVLVAIWAAGVWIFTRLIARSRLSSRAQRLETASYCVNAVLLSVVSFYLGGGLWLSAAFYVLLIIMASTSLPTSHAILVATIAWVGFSFLVFGRAAGVLHPPAIGRPTDSPALVFAAVTSFVLGVTLLLAILLQRWLLGALRKSEASHRALLEAATDLVVTLDETGTILGANEAFARGAGRTGGAILGARIEDVIAPHQREAWRDDLGAAIRGRRMPFQLEFTAPDGSIRWLVGTLSPLVHDRSSRRVLMVARDITDERALLAQRQITMAREAAGQLTTTVERAVREVFEGMENSLREVSEKAEALRSHMSGDEQTREVEAIRDEAARLRDVATDVLGWVASTRREPGEPAQS